MADFKKTTFNNKIDHFSESEVVNGEQEWVNEDEWESEIKTYKQRYWINDDYWDPEKGPVFLYICGEWTCTPPDHKMFPFIVGAEFSAMLINIEHRYYGQSQPVENWTTENLKYLTSEQALADLAYFIEVSN
jgi:hypothetical protein